MTNYKPLIKLADFTIKILITFTSIFTLFYFGKLENDITLIIMTWIFLLALCIKGMLYLKEVFGDKN